MVVDDGSRDGPGAVVPADSRIRLLRHADNRGLGAALNTGLEATTAGLVAYLPADDAWDGDHLDRLVRILDSGVVLAWSGVRWVGGETAGAPAGHPLQLVQVGHRRTGLRWPERDDLESDDLGLLMWSRLAGATGATGVVTATWTDHPGQRHKAIRESYDGGVNVFRRRYAVRQPLRLHSTDSGLTDEVSLYRRFRDRPDTPAAPDGLRILLVGELAFNPERVLALEERGHRLYGLWTDDGLGAHTVGPLPFGHCTDVTTDVIRELRPDVVYGLLNWRAVPLAHAVRRSLPEVPFVWHFKEAPQACVRRGTWPQLVELCTDADQVLFATDEERAYMDLALPGRLDPDRTGVLDGDLPKGDWFTGPRSARLSERDGELHTAVLGRPLGIDAELMISLGRAGIHLHLHGQVTDRGPAAGWPAEVARAEQAVPGYVHRHPRVEPQDWVGTLSRYDAGWLHRFRSANGGDLRRAVWDDLNAPARIPTYACAGLPMLQQRSPGSIVAAGRIVGAAGVLYDDVDELVTRLGDRAALARTAQASWDGRRRFSFDTWCDELVAVLRRAAAARWVG